MYCIKGVGALFQKLTQIIVETTQKLPLCKRKKVAMAWISGHQSWTWDSTTKIQGEKRIPETKDGSFYQGWKIWKMSGVFFFSKFINCLLEGKGRVAKKKPSCLHEIGSVFLFTCYIFRIDSLVFLDLAQTHPPQTVSHWWISSLPC